ncbi:hypothetical protein [Lentzea albidocapillata]|uniref:Uncharacterized protein n=1 Tax=Lentzea albidocapillata TaxID=40571 RepID=A0A1W2FSP4_9PSEU|nr:hypothetical protein [Lentzea albidocapillata]SMD24752.1 hypothetical protein SAMN05660733_07832 [Lentzea albidocapillata]
MPRVKRPRAVPYVGGELVRREVGQIPGAGAYIRIAYRGMVLAPCGVVIGVLRE